MGSIRVFVAALCLAAAPLIAQDPPIGETRPNVRVLKNLRESELFLAMNFVADSLGVHCDHCHVKDGAKWMWADESKPAKAKGREMMAMVATLNQSHFGGASRVTCYTCHRGSLDVARLVPLPPAEVAERTGQRPAETLPTAQQVLGRYLTAIGAPRDGAGVRGVRIAGAIERTEGRRDTFELRMQGEEQAQLRITRAEGVVEFILAGQSASMRAQDKVTELTPSDREALERSLAMYAPVKVRESVQQMKVAGTEVIDGRKTYVVHVHTAGVLRRKLYFDVASGLLLRNISIRETAFVPLLEQFDFSDYRDAGGVKVPFVIRTSDVAPYDTATRRISKVEFESGADE